MNDVVQFYNAWSDTYDEPDFLLALEKPLTLTLCDPCAGVAALEVGAGTGRITLELLNRGASVTAVEPAQRMQMKLLSKTRAYSGSNRLRVLPCTMWELDSTEETFDLVLLPMVVDHIPDLTDVFRLSRKVLSPKGRLVISCVNPYYQIMVRKCLVCRGDERNSAVDPCGASTKIGAHCHVYADVLRIARETGFELDNLLEAQVNEEIATQFPAIADQVGYPVVYAARFVRNCSDGRDNR